MFSSEQSGLPSSDEQLKIAKRNNEYTVYFIVKFKKVKIRNFKKAFEVD